MENKHASRASNAENASIWWQHHERKVKVLDYALRSPFCEVCPRTPSRRIIMPLTGCLQFIWEAHCPETIKDCVSAAMTRCICWLKKPLKTGIVTWALQFPMNRSVIACSIGPILCHLNIWILARKFPTNVSSTAWLIILSATMPLYISFRRIHRFSTDIVKPNRAC